MFDFALEHSNTKSGVLELLQADMPEMRRLFKLCMTSLFSLGSCMHV